MNSKAGAQLLWCPACAAWQSGGDGCPVCACPLADALAPGLPVRVAYETGRERLGWARVERFTGLVESVGSGPWPMVDVRTDAGVRSAWCGRATPDTARVRAAEGMRAAIAFAIRWSDGADVRAMKRALKREDDAARAAEKGLVESMTTADELRARHEADGTTRGDAMAEVLRHIQTAIVTSHIPFDPRLATADNVAPLAEHLSGLWLYFCDLTNRVLVPSLAPPPRRKLYAVK